mmetsp:Transcript_32909/g.66410  ORF Transcript_32909/g.66410 Transcript_32909/m.66410 type:complete len:137 (-) Transcript_32909:2528-2938(-)
MSTAASAPASTSRPSTSGTTSSSIAAAAATPTPAPSTKSNNNQDAPKSADTILGSASAATNAVRVFGKAGGAVDGTTGTRTATSHTIPKPHLPVLIIPGFMSRWVSCWYQLASTGAVVCFHLFADILPFQLLVPHT